MIVFSLILTAPVYYAQNVRIWATFFGGADYDEGWSVAVDDSGYVYMTGKTVNDSGIAYNGYQNNYGGGASDVYLVKFSSNGSRIWATYFGGSGAEEWSTVAVDDSGNVYLAGSTTSDSGIAYSGFQDSLRGTEDAFLARFDRNGNLVWSTYYGGPSSEEGLAVKTDHMGNIYLGGITYSSAYIASGGYQNTYAGTGDSYAVKFDPDGNRIWATYIGGPWVDFLYYMNVDRSNNLLIGGASGSMSGIASGGHQITYGGGSYDAFLFKLDPAGNRIWSTYYGGPDTDMAFAVASDWNGNIYLAGFTESDTNISYHGFQNDYGGGAYDDFLVKFDSSGVRQWATYYGGTATEDCYGLATDNAGFVYLAGVTSSTDGIAFAGFRDFYAGGANDAFLAKFDSEGNRYCATYYGGFLGDRGFNVAVDPAGYVYLTGRTYSPNSIAFNGFQSYSGGYIDAFLVKFASCMNSGTDDEEELGISLFPNPTSGTITITGLRNIQEISVFNSLGQEVYRTISNQPQTVINLSGLEAGIYLVKVSDGTREFAKRLVIIQ